MRTLPATGSAPQMDDDQVIPEDLIGRLYRATENTVFDLLPDLSLQERACLAMFCYRKSHLHRIGLAIAATCDETVLVQTWGTALGHTLYTQSREAPARPPRPPGNRYKITLARLTGDTPPAFHDDIEDEPSETSADLSLDTSSDADAPAELTVALT
jgi:hypothetical protein